MAPSSRLDIDLSALDHNCRTWRQILGPRRRLCAVVKADAYGLGALPIVRRLVANHVDMLAVYSPEQAAELLAAGVVTPILILMPIEQLDRTDALYRPLVAGKLHLSVHSLRQLEYLDHIGRTFGTPVSVHPEIDTGMNRLGMPLDEAHAILSEIADRRYLRLGGILSHAASANNDPIYTRQQHQRFAELLQAHEDAVDEQTIVHFAGTFAALRDSAYHETMVRLGLGLFGYGPDNLAEPHHALPALPPLKPVLRWVSRIVHLKDVPAGQGVGYNLEYTTDRPSRLAIVPVGYGDGYPWTLRGRSCVRVGEGLHEVPVRGQVNMDQIIIDVTDLPPESADIGSEVEIIAADRDAPNALHRIAELAGSTCYETLCRLSPRVPRRYVTPNRAAIDNSAAANC